MSLSEMTEIKKISKFDVFIELFSAVVFLDIVFYLKFAKGIFYFTDLESVFSYSNIGKFLLLITIYVIYRNVFSTFICHILFKLIFKLKKEKNLSQIVLRLFTKWKELLLIQIILFYMKE